MLLLFAGCVALGVWQLERLQWKLALISEVNGNMQLPAVPVDRALAQGVRNYQYRHVSLQGRFDNAREAYVFAGGENGIILYHVVTPFALDDGRVLLVDRGAVPESLRDPHKRAAGELQGEQRIVGVLRVPDSAGLFTPSPNRKDRIWYARDVKAIAQADGVKLAAPVIIEADAAPNPGGWPEGGQTVVAFRNEHLQYALTWFALAAVTLGGWIAFHVSRRRLHLK